MDQELPPVPVLVPLCRVTAEVGRPTALGTTPLGERKVIPIVGGTVTPLPGREDDGLTGTVSPGEDWQWVHPDGTLEISAHYRLHLGDAVVEVHSDGLRTGSPAALARMVAGERVAAAEYTFQTFVRARTGAPAYAWLNRAMVVARGVRAPRGVLLDYYEVR